LISVANAGQLALLIKALVNASQLPGKALLTVVLITARTVNILG
jgi:hypothetical protein